jgi:triosephosphate isomerase (TIM)
MSMGPLPIIIGNWKMHGLWGEGKALVEALLARLASHPAPKAEIAICPPFTLLAPCAQILSGHKVILGAQDCHHAQKGAYTGDISAEMLADSGALMVIIGHSERRVQHGESDATIKEKMAAAHKAGLRVIFCIGETQQERDAGQTLTVCSSQLSAGMASSATAENTIIAYEPVWAIGTGRTPTADEVEDVHAHIRRAIEPVFGPHNRAVPIIYGGSVKASNAQEFLALPNVNGALVGGASLKIEEFVAIINALPK